MSDPEPLWLCGDEDCGVGINCRLCDRGGAPIAYYTTDPADRAYVETDVAVVHTIVALLDAGKQHLRDSHGLEIR